MEQLRGGERQDFQIEARYRRKNGQPVWIHNTVSLIPGVGESSSFVMLIAKDITARRDADDNLKKQNEALQKIFDHVPVMINLASKDGSIKLVNREWERILGWSLEEILRDTLDIFSLCYPDPDYRRGVLKFLAETPNTWAEFKTRTRDGRILDTSWALVELSDGTVIGSGRDITATKRAEEALKRSEAYLAESQRLSHIGSWACDARTRQIIFWSSEHYRIFGFDPDSCPIKLAEVRERVHPEDRSIFDSISNSMSFDKSDFAVDLRLILPDGSMKYVHSIGHPVLNEAGELVEFTGAVVDATDRKRAEAELRRSVDQLRALAARVQDAREEERTRVAREIHDELGQALTSIKIDLSSLIHEFPPEPQQLKRIESISTIVDQTIKSIRRISTELRPGILDDLGLIAAVEWAAEEFEARTGTKCRLDLPDNDGAIDPDRATAVFRILQETLTNVARHAKATCVDVRLLKESAGVILEVHDNGKGATEEQLSAAESLGIRGMRERALLLGGELIIQGVPSQGTSIRVSIPLTDALTESGSAGA
jgi:PAS domain S-box-containing protein